MLSCSTKLVISFLLVVLWLFLLFLGRAVFRQAIRRYYSRLISRAVVCGSWLLGGVNAVSTYQWGIVVGKYML